MRSDRPFSSLLGWAEPEFLVHAEQKPTLALRLWTAPRQKLHLVAFLLSNSQGQISTQVLENAVTLPARTVLADLGFGGLKGLRRALGRIPGAVLEPPQYRRIVSLLSDSSTARLLHHSPEITASLLTNLENLPGPLRSHAIAKAIGSLPGAAGALIEWTALAAERSPLSRSPSDIQRILGSAGSFLELKACLGALVDELPALEGPPPLIVGRAIRVDRPSEVRGLGKQFDNCLDGFVDVEIDGASHIYHWRSPEAEAVCEVRRTGNVGWFLGSHLGPTNEELAPSVAAAIKSDFRAAGIRELSVAGVYEDLFFARGRYEQPESHAGYTARNRLPRLD